MAVQSETNVHPARGWRIEPVHSFVAAAICWAGFAVMVWLVTSGRTARFDDFGLLFWRQADGLGPRGPDFLLKSVRDVTALGGVFLRSLFAIAAIGALLFLKLRREATLLGATVLLGWIVNTVMKHLVGRPRPEIVPHLAEASGASFPSGHSFNSAVIYIAIALAFAAMSARRSVRWTIIAAAIAISLAIAWSRVWLGVHYPSDVIAGWLGGAGWAFLAAAIFQRPASVAADAAAGRDDQSGAQVSASRGTGTGTLK